MLVLGFTAAGFAQNKSVNQPKAVSKTIDSLSYMLGVDVATSMKQLPVKVDVASFYEAFSGIMNETVSISKEQSNAFLQSYFLKLQSKAADENKKAGEKFLAENKNRPGVVTLPSGLQYKVEREGTGISPTATDKVEVNYRGTLIDGSVFDSSYDRGESITFGVSKVIKGWTEGLQLMKEGGKTMFFIPSDLAYGDQDRGGVIKGGSTLIFEVELIKVVKEE